MCHSGLSQYDLLTCKMTNTIASTVRFVVVCYQDSGTRRYSPLSHRSRSKPLKGFWKCVQITVCFVKLVVQLPLITTSEAILPGESVPGGSRHSGT